MTIDDIFHTLKSHRFRLLPSDLLRLPLAAASVAGRALIWGLLALCRQKPGVAQSMTDLAKEYGTYDEYPYIYYLEYLVAVALKDYQAAIRHLENCVQFSQTLPNYTLQIDARRALASLLRGIGEQELAREHTREAQILEELEVSR